MSARQPHLTTAQRDRAAGVLVGQACGDALGVPYEFQPAFDGHAPEMIGGGLGPYAPGEWSDDTQMAICIARITAHGPLDDIALGRIGLAFAAWRRGGASDIGTQTATVLTRAASALDGGAGTPGGPVSTVPDAEVAEVFRQAAQHYCATHERSAGNGALMRNGIVGLTALGDRAVTCRNAGNVAALTHADPLVTDSCVLHAEAIRHAVLTGEYDIFAGIDLVPERRRQQWVQWLETAENVDPASIAANGSTFGALRAAHAAVTSTKWARFSVHREGAREHVRAALEVAASAGHDTDTVAAITGALVGAVYGFSAIPASWRRRIHGWPGMRARDLMTLALQTAGQDDADAWPLREHEASAAPRRPVPLPCDDGLLLGTQGSLATADVDAIVSLSRIGTKERRFGDSHPENHVEFWLVDSNDPAKHNDVSASLEDAADTILELRQDGHRVLLHCVHAHHRTPSVALLYAVKHCGRTTEEAEAEICSTLGVAEIEGLLWQEAMWLARYFAFQRSTEPRGYYDFELMSADDPDAGLSPMYVAAMRGDITDEEYARWMDVPRRR